MRDQFFEVKDVPVLDLMLDVHNPRIREGADQTDCIARLLRSGESFMKLLKDIAENGLTPEPILLSRGEDEKWIVRDGNRRVAALKLLNLPTLCENASIRALIERFSASNRENIASRVDCIASSSEDLVVEYLKRKHTGENEGIGQRNWSALLTSLFNYHSGFTDQHRRAIQLILWVESRGLPVDDDFPITTLTRMLSKHSFNMIGFKVEEDKLVPMLPENQAYALAARLIQDIGRKVINVSRDPEDTASVYTPTAQDEYFLRIRSELGPPLSSDADNVAGGGSGADVPASEGGASGATGGAQPGSEEVSRPQTGTGGTSGGGGSGGISGSGVGSRSGGGAGGQTSTSTPSWDRKCIFPQRRVSFALPARQTKAANVIVELKKLNSKETPQSIAMLFRTLIELSEKRYRETHGLKEADAFHKKIAAAADHMRFNGRLTEGQHEAVIRRTREDNGILHVKTLHAYVHSEDFHPSFQIINSLWDEIGCFVAACWS